MATGERHGGFNFGELDGTDFDSEHIIAYEIGAKTEWLDRTLIVNADVFFYDYKGKFYSETLNNVSFTRNIPEAEVLGVELQFWWIPLPNLRINGTASYLDTEVTGDTPTQLTGRTEGNPTGFCAFKPEGDQHGNGPTCDGGELVNLKGNTLQKSPQFTVNLGFEYHIQLASGTLVPRLDFSWRDDFNYHQFDSKLDEQESYSRTNFRVRYNPSDERWWLEAFVENIENNDDVRTNLNNRGSLRKWFLAAPRVFGLRFRWNFSGGDLPWVS